MKTTSDLLEKVSASYLTMKWQQELFLTPLNFFSAKDGNFLISPAFFCFYYGTLVCFESFVFVKVTKVLLLAAHLDTAYYSDCE